MLPPAWTYPLVVLSKPFGKGRERDAEETRLCRALARFHVARDLLVLSREEVDYRRVSLNHVVARALREGRVLYKRHQARTGTPDRGEAGCHRASRHGRPRNIRRRSLRISHPASGRETTKAWRASSGETYPLSRDLAAFPDLLGTRGAEVARYRGLVNYTRFAVRLRYSTADPGKETLDRGQAAGKMESLLTEVRQALVRAEHL